MPTRSRRSGSFVKTTSAAVVTALSGPTNLPPEGRGRIPDPVQAQGTTAPECRKLLQQNRNASTVRGEHVITTEPGLGKRRR